MEEAKSNSNGTHSDLTYLRELAKGSNAFIIQMVNIYIRQTPAALDRIDNALKNKDWPELRLAVHKLKPSVIFVGLNEIINDITLLEDYAIEESHPDEMPGMIDKIKTVCKEAIPELEEELKRLQ